MKCFSSDIAVVFAQSIEVIFQLTPSEWSTISLPTKVWFILDFDGSMVADGQAMQGARASAAMLLTRLSSNFLVSTPEGSNICVRYHFAMECGHNWLFDDILFIFLYTRCYIIQQKSSDPSCEAYHQVSNIRHTESQNLDVSHFGLQLSLCNISKPGVKLKMKM